MSKLVWLAPLAAVLAALATAVFLPGAATSAVPASGTVSPTATSVTWQGGPAVTSNPSNVCVGGVTLTCDRYQLTVVPPAAGTPSGLGIKGTIPNAGGDWGLFVDAPHGD